MKCKFTEFMIFQPKESLEEFLDGKNAALNREVMMRYHEIEDKVFCEPNMLDVMNETWYLTKKIFMQQEPVLFGFKSTIHAICKDSPFSKIACLLSYYILKRQMYLPKRIEEFMPELKKIVEEYSRILFGFPSDPFNECLKFSDNEESWGEPCYNTHLYLEMEFYRKGELCTATHKFDKDAIREMLPFYGTKEVQRGVLRCIKASYEDTVGKMEDYEELPF